MSGPLADEEGSKIDVNSPDDVVVEDIVIVHSAPFVSDLYLDM